MLIPDDLILHKLQAVTILLWAGQTQVSAQKEGDHKC